MSVIDSIIPPQAFENIRDRIGEILADELNNQVLLSYDTDIDATVYSERFVPFDKTELPAINVVFVGSPYDNEDQKGSDGTYLYNVDCYHFAKNTEDDDGDVLASIKLHKVMGKCRAIIKDTRYKTLGFAPPYISRVRVKELFVNEPNHRMGDAINVIMGRVIVEVRIMEGVEQIIPVLLANNTTQVKLELTDKGYKYSIV